MKITLYYKQWARVKKQLGLVKLEDKINYKGYIKKCYTLPIKPNRFYPRFHFETQFISKYRHIVDIHIDWVRHTESDGFHPLIDELVEKINNIK